MKTETDEVQEETSSKKNSVNDAINESEPEDKRAEDTPENCQL